MVSEVILPV